MHYFYYDLSDFPDKEVAKSAKEFTDLYRAKYNKPPDAYATIAYVAYTEMFRGSRLPSPSIRSRCPQR